MKVTSGIAVALLITLLFATVGPLQSQQAVTPAEYADAETHLYREGVAQPMALYVVKPDGWAEGDRRSAWIHFYGGGWQRGSPESSLGWARSAAKRGMIGIAPDYRVRDRFNGATPLECVADARAALRWVQENADKLGIDPDRIVVSGTSAGGHLAAWTGIKATPPGSDPEEAPLARPAALILSSPACDVSPETGMGAIRFGEHATALSPLHQAEREMPPTLMFHGDADAVVAYRTAAAYASRMEELGNHMEFITVEGGSHNYRNDLPEWKQRTTDLMAKFLEEQGILPAIKE